MWRRVLVGALAMAVTTPFLGGLPAEATVDLSVTLPLTSVGHIVVDQPHQKVYVSGGPGGQGVLVTDWNGGSAQLVPGTAGADGMVLSPDGSKLYAGMSDAHQIDVIDTTSLALTSYATAGLCPRSVAVSKTQVWFTYFCDVNNPQGMGLLDLTGAPVVTKGLDGNMITGPDSRVVYASGTLLGTGSTNMLAFHVSGAKLTLLTHSWGTFVNLVSATLSPDGATVYAGTTDAASAWGVDGSRRPVLYPTSTQVLINALAPSPDGKLLALGAQETETGYPLTVFDAASGTLLRTYSFPPAVNPRCGHATVMPADIAWGGLDRLFAISGECWQAPFVLHISDTFIQGASTMTLTGPASAVRGGPVSLVGQLQGSGQGVSGATVAVSRTDQSGTVALPSAVTDASGAFTLPDTPQVGGPVTYAANYSGDRVHGPASASFTVQVSRLATAVTVSVNGRVFVYGGAATITAHLGPTYSGRTLSLYVYVYGVESPSWTLMYRGMVDAAGNVVLATHIYRHVSIQAAFDGDYRTAPASASVGVTSLGRLAETVVGGYARSGSYELVHHSNNPTLLATIAPTRRLTGCGYIVVQAYASGAWRLVTVSGCRIFSDHSQVWVSFVGIHPVGVPYRSYTYTRSDVVNAATTGPFVYFRFT